VIIVVAFTSFSLNLYREVFYPVMALVSTTTPGPYETQTPAPFGIYMAPTLGFADAVHVARAEAARRGFDTPPGGIYYGGDYAFYNVSFVGTQALADELGKDGAGVVVSQVMPSPYNAARPIAREFADAVKAAGKDAQVNFSSMEGYVAAKLFVEGLKRAGSKLSRESLIAGLEGLGSQSLGGFSVSFSPTDHVASSFVELSMLTGDGRVRT